MTQQYDQRGLSVSTSSTEAVTAYVEALDAMLSGNVGAPEALDRALGHDPDFALAHAARALTYQFQGRTDDARASADRSVGLAERATQRERQHAAAMAAIVGGETTRAVGLVREHLAEFPRDALLLSQASFLFNNSGRRTRNAELLALLDGVAGAAGGDWYVMSARAFVLHELDRLAESRALSERSLALQPRNALAVHNIAHVCYESNAHAEGRTFLSGWMPGYAPRAPQHCHLAWHHALFELTSGNARRAVELYEASVQPSVAWGRSLLPDNASLLWRLELYGAAEAPLPWRAVADLATRLCATPGAAFSDAHAALAYAGAADQAALDRLIDGLRALHTAGNELVGEVVLPLVEGIRAFGERDYRAAVDHLEPVMPEVVRIGGSNAQREVFEETLLHAYLRSDLPERAEALLRRRLGRRHAARDFFWLGEAQAARGQSAAAAASLAAASHGWPDADPALPQVAALARARAALPEHI